MSFISTILNALASDEAKSAEAWATERLDNALASLVAGLERAWDRRGLRYHEMWLRAVHRLAYWSGREAGETGMRARWARRKVRRWTRIERERRIRAESAPPFPVGDLWLTAQDIMKALGE